VRACEPGPDCSRHRHRGRVPHERSRLRSFARDRMSALVTVENLQVRFRSGRRHGARGQRRRLQPEPWRGAGVAGANRARASRVTLRALMRLLPPSAPPSPAGSASPGRDVLALDEAALGSYRGAVAAMIFQEPMLAFDPVFTVGDQIAEAVMRHEGVGRDAAAPPRARDARARCASPRPRGAWMRTPTRCRAACASAR